MTTSGSVDFNQTRNEIITDSLVLLGIYDPGDTVNSSDINFCSNILNKMVKGWEAQGLHLWTAQEATLFLNLNQKSYSLSSSSSTDICGDDAKFTTLTADASGASLTVDSTTGFSVSDKIGIVLDDLTTQWTTIASVDSTTAVTLNASLTSAASSGNSVFVFTTRTDRPLAITSARYRDGGGSERPIERDGRTDFMEIPLKDSTGPTIRIFYSPKVSSATLYTWPVCDDPNGCITFSYLRRIQDFDSSSDNPDLPQEWLECITYNLAIRIASAYGIATQKLNPDISLIAQSSLAEMTLWDDDDGSLIICPAYRMDGC